MINVSFRKRRYLKLTIFFWIINVLSSKLSIFGRQFNFISIACCYKIAFFYCALPRAHETYASAMAGGDDGRKPDFVARKSCNYLEDAVEVGRRKHKDIETVISCRNVETN